MYIASDQWLGLPIPAPVVLAGQDTIIYKTHKITVISRREPQRRPTILRLLYLKIIHLEKYVLGQRLFSLFRLETCHGNALPSLAAPGFR